MSHVICVHAHRPQEICIIIAHLYITGKCLAVKDTQVLQPRLTWITTLISAIPTTKSTKAIRVDIRVMEPKLTWTTTLTS